MVECPHCGHTVADGLNECSHCMADVSVRRFPAGTSGSPISQRTPFSPIARFRSVAEAGFFSSELEGALGCEVRLTADEHFEAAHAHWNCEFVLSVPEANVDEAAALLETLIGETAGSVFTEYGLTAPSAFEEAVASRTPASDFQLPGTTPFELHTHSPGDAPPINWVPVVLTLAAGGFVFWGAHRVHQHLHPPAGRQLPLADFWHELEGTGDVWIQTTEQGTVRELFVDADELTAVIREDTDGDGLFEGQRRFELESLTRE